MYILCMYVNLYVGLMCLTDDDDDDSAAMTLVVVVVVEVLYIQGIENGATHSILNTHTQFI